MTTSTLNFISLGSGSSGNCYYLYTDDEGIIIDIGIGIRTLKKSFKEYGLTLSPDTNILITHDHADHVKTIGAFSKDRDIPVYATSKVLQGIINNYRVKHKVPAHLARVIETDKTFRLGEFEITPFTVPHDSSDNVGYSINYRGIIFCIITDIGHVTDEIAAHISTANYLVIESNYDREMLTSGPYSARLKERIASNVGHLSNTECAHAVAKNCSGELKHVWLCHLSEENNHPELARKTFEDVLRKDYGLIAGKDFMLDVLKRKTPSGVFVLDF